MSLQRMSDADPDLLERRTLFALPHLDAHRTFATFDLGRLSDRMVNACLKTKSAFSLSKYLFATTILISRAIDQRRN